jgi:hypothetical protein
MREAGPYRHLQGRSPQKITPREPLVVVNLRVGVLGGSGVGGDKTERGAGEIEGTAASKEGFPGWGERSFRGEKCCFQLSYFYLACRTIQQHFEPIENVPPQDYFLPFFISNNFN